MEIDTKFDNDSLMRIEKILLDHPVARRYFQGVLYDLRGSRLPKFKLERASGNVVELDEVSAGRLFMIPDDSIVWALSEWEGPGRPAGLAVQSRSPFLRGAVGYDRGMPMHTSATTCGRNLALTRSLTRWT